MFASIADPLLRSMNTHVNMLYVDQPNSVGFSYDVVLNSTFDTLFLVPEALNDTGVVSFDDYPEGVPEANSTLWYGSFPSQNILHTANTTAIAARTLWHFAQGFFGSFPEYKTCNKDISLWGNSYGGYTVSVTAAYFVSQNEKIQNEKIQNGKLNGGAAAELPVDTIGFTNGCTDLLYQLEYYPQMAYNNTYGLQVINETVYEMAVAAVPACLQLVRDCRSLSEEYDPDQFAFNATVNAICANATATCAAIGAAYDTASNVSNAINLSASVAVLDSSSADNARFPEVRLRYGTHETGSLPAVLPRRLPQPGLGAKGAGRPGQLHGGQ